MSERRISACCRGSSFRGPPRGGFRSRSLPVCLISRALTEPWRGAAAAAPPAAWQPGSSAPRLIKAPSCQNGTATWCHHCNAFSDFRYRDRSFWKFGAFSSFSSSSCPGDVMDVRPAAVNRNGARPSKSQRASRGVQKKSSNSFATTNKQFLPNCNIKKRGPDENFPASSDPAPVQLQHKKASVKQLKMVIYLSTARDWVVLLLLLLLRPPPPFCPELPYGTSVLTSTPCKSSSLSSLGWR